MRADERVSEKDELIREAERQMLICNACRYCEGYCAVWPTIELRRRFGETDVEYLANLCFDCRACYYACQYAPPHEFAINPPKIFAEVRRATYARYARPRGLARVLGNRGWPTMLVTLACVLAVVALVLALAGPAAVLGAQVGPEAFYRVVPYEWMVVPFALLGLGWLVVWIAGVVPFGRNLRAMSPGPTPAAAFLAAIGDALSLRYLGGDGDGCTYPTERFSMARRWFHHLVFYGFLLDTASTTLAAIYDHLFHSRAPYPVFHPVVVVGTLGGIGLIVGCVGLLSLKRRSDPAPSEPAMTSMDVAFVVNLLLAAVTGMLLLGLRDTAAMGTLLAVHLGVIVALFVTAPYGKFVHLLYRYAALVQYAIEQRHAAATTHAGH